MQEHIALKSEADRSRWVPGVPGALEVFNIRVHEKHVNALLNIYIEHAWQELEVKMECTWSTGS